MEDFEEESYDTFGRVEAGVGLGFGGGREGQGRRRALSQPGPPPGLRLEGDEGTLAAGVMRDVERKKQRVPLGGRSLTWTAGGSDSEPESEEGRRNKVIDLSHGVEDPWRGARSSFEEDDALSDPTVRRVPSILLTTDSGSDTILADPPGSSRAPSPLPIPQSSPTHRRRRHRDHLLRAFRRALFPSLQSFRSKSILGSITALLCTPALLALNLTLPVVEEPTEEASSSWGGEKTGPPSINGGPTPGEVEEDAIERVGRQLHSPAIDAHRHNHPSHGHDTAISHSHHLQHVRAAAAEDETPSRAWEEVSTTPLESPSRPSTPQQLEYFRIVNSSEASEASRVAPTEHGSVPESDEEELRNDEALEEKATDQVTRILTAVQCAIGPLFCVCALLCTYLPLPLSSSTDRLLTPSRQPPVVLPPRRCLRRPLLRRPHLPLLREPSTPRSHLALLPRFPHRHGVDPDDRQRGCWGLTRSSLSPHSFLSNTT
jgi:sodium/potassium/calcium exchanger 6